MARRWWWRLTEPSIEERVIAFVAKQADGRKPVRISDHLSEDFGIDGDEAVDFFEAFEAEFQVDLEPLYQPERPS